MNLEGSSNSWNQSNTNSNINTTSICFMDELVKEYLLFRGFNNCLKSLEQDLKQDKDKSFRSDKITDQLLSYIYSYDLNGLLDYWTYLDMKYFSRITLKLSINSSVSLIRKYELFLLRYYLIHSIQTSKTEKAFEFFENYASKLQSQVEWKEWYCLPFLKNPEENSFFSVYFTKNWIDTFIVSLQNFLNIVFQSVQFPRLLNYEEDQFWNKNLNPKTINNNSAIFEQEYLQQEITDEFQIIHSNETQNKPGYNLISLLKNLANPRSKPSSNSNQISSQNQASTGSNSVNDSKPNVNKTNYSSSFIANKKQSFVNNTELKPKNSRFSSGNLQSNIAKSQFYDEPESKPTLDDSHFQKTQQQLGNQLELKTETKSSKEEKQISKEKSEPFITLSNDEYCEHKSSISLCKISKDGKLIASVDSQGIIKIWSVDNSMNTVTTLMQRSVIVSLEWDKRNSSCAYFGTNSGIVKVYDNNVKRFIQELNLNKIFPIVTNICSSPYSNKVIVMASSKHNHEISDVIENKNHQMAICKNGQINNNLIIEKFFDLEGFFCNCSVFYSANFFILGCSDGHLRIFDLENQIFSIDTKCHSRNIFNLFISKDQSLVYTLSTDMNFKVWIFDSASFHFKNLSSSNLSNKINLREFSSTKSNEYESNLFNNNLIAFDTSYKFMFLLDKNGANLAELSDFMEQNDQNLIQINEIGSYLNQNSSMIEIWNASHSLILLIGGTNGKIRVLKLLNQL